MKEEANKEMDLLLRRLAQRDGVAGAAKARAEQHLDTDELSSYAQNVLTPAARARCTEHLAECAACRKLVTELSLSLGSAAVAEPSEAAHAPSALKNFLASLFSPLVLRYAVPALGVLIVMAIGFVVLRRQRQQEFVAQVEQQKTAPVATPGATPLEGQVNFGLTDQRAREVDHLKQANTAPAEPTVKKEAVAGEGKSGAVNGGVASAPAKAL